MGAIKVTSLLRTHVNSGLDLTGRQMSDEQLKAFLAAVQSDTALQKKLKGDLNSDAVTAIAKEAGFEISVDALKQLQQESGQLSEIKLELISGGQAGSTHPIGTQYLKACCEA
jgi:predicted ribosomally synthesized peptide with nif11-like leader